VRGRGYEREARRHERTPYHNPGLMTFWGAAVLRTGNGVITIAMTRGKGCRLIVTFPKTLMQETQRQGGERAQTLPSEKNVTGQRCFPSQEPTRSADIGYPTHDSTSAPHLVIGREEREKKEACALQSDFRNVIKHAILKKEEKRISRELQPVHTLSMYAQMWWPCLCAPRGCGVRLVSRSRSRAIPLPPGRLPSVMGRHTDI